MSLFGIILLAIVVANLVWGIKTSFQGAGWIYWVNIIGSILLALGYFLKVIPL